MEPRTAVARNVEVSIQQVERKLKIDSSNAFLMAASLAVAIDNYVEGLALPNDPDRLAAHNSHVGILKEVSDGLAHIALNLEAPPGQVPEEDKIADAARVISSLKNAISNWLSENAEAVVSFGLNTALLGAGCAFLTFCGAPTWQAFPAVAFLLKGRPLVDSFKGIDKKGA
jgi:hypothetical protein